MKQEIAIVGAGIAGLTAALMLEQMGFSVSLFESDKKVRGIGAGMALASNAMKALNQLELGDAIEPICHPLTAFSICDPDGRSIIDVDIKRIEQNYRLGNYSVYRPDLHSFLADRLKRTPVYTAKELASLKYQDDKVWLTFSDHTEKAFDFVIGTDGINSVVRQSFLPQSIPRYAGYWCWRGVVDISEIENVEGLEIWGKQGRFGVTPMVNNRVYWFACINTDLKDNIKNYGLKQLQKHFQAYPTVIRELLVHSDSEKIISGAILDIKPVQQFYFDRVLLIGDAAHATTPNMGQGACMAIEDVAVLQDELKRHSIQMELAAKNTAKRRIDRTTYIIKNSKLAGQIAQLENRSMITLRNFLFRTLPAGITQRPLKRLYEEDFLEV